MTLYCPTAITVSENSEKDVNIDFAIVGANWLIDASISKSANDNDILSGMTDFVRAKEFSSVFVKLPRRTGNTEVAIQTAIRHQPSMILTTTKHNTKDIINRLKLENIRSVPVKTLDSSFYRYKKDFSKTTVVVDNASTVDTDKFNILYSLGAKFYVFVG